MSMLTGTGALVRLILRRDRVLMPIWILIVALLPLSQASGLAAIYPTDEGRRGYIEDLGSSPLLIAFYGPKPAESSLGALLFWRLGTGIVIMALIGLLVTIRHTRVEEEAGRRELIGSTVVGRHANLAAALVAVTGAALLAGVLIALGVMSQDVPAAGAFAMGMSWASATILFAAIGAVLAQLTEGAGAARGLGVLTLAILWVVRAIGDIEPSVSWLSWASPTGWPFKVGAFIENRWWVLGLVAVLVAALTYLAVKLSARRDVGAGMLPPRLGPEQASASLRSPLALAWRLHRGPIYAWTAGMLVFGILIGAAAQIAADLMEDSEQLRQVMQRLGGAAQVGDLMLATGFNLFAVFVAGYAISAALRLRTEEAALRSEPVLATAVGRIGWAASHLTFALLGPAIVLLATGLGAGLMHGADTGDLGRELPRSIAGALVQLPAIWVLVALTMAVFGLLPRISSAFGWAALAFCFLLGQVGALLQLDQIVLDLSPFTHIPRVPGGDFTATPLLILAGITAVLIAVGLAAFRRRDIPVT